MSPVKSLSILLFSESATFTSMYERQLKALSFAVTTSKDIDHVERILLRTPYDAFLIDMAQINADLIQALRSLKEKHRSLPFVVIAPAGDVRAIEKTGVAEKVMAKMARPNEVDLKIGEAILEQIEAQLAVMAEFEFAMREKCDAVTGLNQRVYFDRIIHERTQKPTPHGRCVSFMELEIDDLDEIKAAAPGTLDQIMNAIAPILIQEGRLDMTRDLAAVSAPGHVTISMQVEDMPDAFARAQAIRDAIRSQLTGRRPSGGNVTVTIVLRTLKAGEIMKNILERNRTGIEMARKMERKDCALPYDDVLHDA